MITKYTNEASGMPDGTSWEAWNTDAENFVGNTWCSVAAGVVPAGSVPTTPTLLMTGTAAATTVNVQWRLNSPGTNCNGGDEYTISSRNYNLGVNTPYTPGDLAWSIPSGVPVGNYEVCVIVDPDNTLSETEETLDNNVFSDRLFQIKSSLSECP